MTQAQLTAYEAVKPTIKIKQAMICEVLRTRGNQSTGELEFHTGMHYTTLGGRLTELWDMGIIYPVGGYEGDRFSIWTLAAFDKMKYIQERRRYAKFMKWIKKGSEFSDLTPDFVALWLKYRI